MKWLRSCFAAPAAGKPGGQRGCSPRVSLSHASPHAPPSCQHSTTGVSGATGVSSEVPAPSSQSTNTTRQNTAYHADYTPNIDHGCILLVLQASIDGHTGNRSGACSEQSLLPVWVQSDRTAGNSDNTNRYLACLQALLAADPTLSRQLESHARRAGMGADKPSVCITNAPAAQQGGGSRLLALRMQPCTWHDQPAVLVEHLPCCGPPMHVSSPHALTTGETPRCHTAASALSSVVRTMPLATVHSGRWSPLLSSHNPAASAHTFRQTASRHAQRSSNGHACTSAAHSVPSAIQAALASRLERCCELLDAAPVCLSLVTVSGELLWLNAASQQYAGGLAAAQQRAVVRLHVGHQQEQECGQQEHDTSFWHQLLQLEGQDMEHDLLTAVCGGLSWTCVCRLPAALGNPLVLAPAAHEEGSRELLHFTARDMDSTSQHGLGATSSYHLHGDANSGHARHNIESQAGAAQWPAHSGQIRHQGSCPDSVSDKMRQGLAAACAPRHADPALQYAPLARTSTPIPATDERSFDELDPKVRRGLLLPATAPTVVGAECVSVSVLPECSATFLMDGHSSHQMAGGCTPTARRGYVQGSLMYNPSTSSQLRQVVSQRPGPSRRASRSWLVQAFEGGEAVAWTTGASCSHFHSFSHAQPSTEGLSQHTGRISNTGRPSSVSGAWCHSLLMPSSNNIAFTADAAQHTSAARMPDSTATAVTSVSAGDASLVKEFGLRASKHTSTTSGHPWGSSGDQLRNLVHPVMPAVARSGSVQQPRFKGDSTKTDDLPHGVPPLKCTTLGPQSSTLLFHECLNNSAGTHAAAHEVQLSAVPTSGASSAPAADMQRSGQPAPSVGLTEELCELGNSGMRGPTICQPSMQLHPRLATLLGAGAPPSQPTGNAQLGGTHTAAHSFTSVGLGINSDGGCLSPRYSARLAPTATSTSGRHGLETDRLSGSSIKQLASSRLSSAQCLGTLHASSSPRISCAAVTATPGTRMPATEPLPDAGRRHANVLPLTPSLHALLFEDGGAASVKAAAFMRKQSAPDMKCTGAVHMVRTPTGGQDGWTQCAAPLHTQCGLTHTQTRAGQTVLDAMQAPQHAADPATPEASRRDGTTLTQAMARANELDVEHCSDDSRANHSALHNGEDSGMHVDAAGEAQQPHATWQEVTVVPFQDPETGQLAALVLQTDVTERSELEQRLLQLTQAQLYMLEQLFPRHVLEQIARRGQGTGPLGGPIELHELGTVAELHDNVTVMFTDVVGFTAMSDAVPPEAVMTFITELFSTLDGLCDKHGVSKYDTSGDCYIVVGGLLEEDEQGFKIAARGGNCAVSQGLHALRVLNYARDMLVEARKVLMPHNGQPVQLRVGLHSGSVVSGLVGKHVPKFSLFGDTMNMASRMESTGAPGRVHVSATTHALLRGWEERWTPTGGVEVKGKGRMETYLLDEDAQQPDAWVALMPNRTDTAPHESGTGYLLGPLVLDCAEPAVGSGPLPHPIVQGGCSVRPRGSWAALGPVEEEGEAGSGSMGCDTCDSVLLSAVGGWSRGSMRRSLPHAAAAFTALTDTLMAQSSASAGGAPRPASTHSSIADLRSSGGSQPPHTLLSSMLSAHSQGAHIRRSNSKQPPSNTGSIADAQPRSSNSNNTHAAQHALHTVDDTRADLAGLHQGSSRQGMRLDEDVGGEAGTGWDRHEQWDEASQRLLAQTSSRHSLLSDQLRSLMGTGAGAGAALAAYGSAAGQGHLGDGLMVLGPKGTGDEMWMEGAEEEEGGGGAGQGTRHSASGPMPLNASPDRIPRVASRGGTARVGQGLGGDGIPAAPLTHLLSTTNSLFGRSPVGAPRHTAASQLGRAGHRPDSSPPVARLAAAEQRHSPGSQAWVYDLGRVCSLPSRARRHSIAAVPPDAVTRCAQLQRAGTLMAARGQDVAGLLRTQHTLHLHTFLHLLRTLSRSDTPAEVPAAPCPEGDLPATPCALGTLEASRTRLLHHYPHASSSSTTLNLQSPHQRNSPSATVGGSVRPWRGLSSRGQPSCEPQPQLASPSVLGYGAEGDLRAVNAGHGSSGSNAAYSPASGTVSSMGPGAAGHGKRAAFLSVLQAYTATAQVLAAGAPAPPADEAAGLDEQEDAAEQAPGVTSDAWE